jgi:hypothetical protein
MRPLVGLSLADSTQSDHEEGHGTPLVSAPFFFFFRNEVSDARFAGNIQCRIGRHPPTASTITSGTG